MEITAHQNGKIVMLVDDRMEIIDLLRELLEPVGYAVVLAHDGDEAVAKFDPRMTAIISDWRMVRMHGDELFRQLESGLGATRFYIFTADPEEFYRKNSDLVPRLAGIIPKPPRDIFDIVRLLEEQT